MSTSALARLVGESKAKALLFVGDALTADEALRLGLVTKVVGEGEALSAALDMARVIARRPAQALRLIKQAVDEGLPLPLEEGLALERELLEQVFQTADVQEGVSAFLERRERQFKHR